MTPPRIDKVRILIGEDNHARTFADGTDICCLHLEYPMVNVIQTRSEEDTLTSW